MLEDSLFASGDLVAKEVTIAGRKVSLHFRELPAVEFHACFVASEGASQKALSPAHLIAASLRNPDGSPALTVERAAQLKNGPFNAIFGVVMEVNGESSGNGLPSAESPGSGTS